jgi:hypothetical protein
MSLANGSKSMARANTRFVDNIRPSGGINVKATKRIRVGQEIIVYYGADYFNPSSRIDPLWNTNLVAVLRGAAQALQAVIPP